MSKPNKYARPPTRLEFYHVQGKVKRSEKSVIFEVDTGTGVFAFHFGDADQLMNFFVLAIEEMTKVFPDHEASKLWMDDTFR